MLSTLIKSIFADPFTKGLDIDDPTTTLLRRNVIREKNYLRKIYKEWYLCFSDRLLTFIRCSNVKVLEIGSGAGFIKEVIPEAITSEVFQIEGVDMVIDAMNLPFKNDSLDAIVMTDVFHHIPNVQLFLEEVMRCLRPGGILLMIEPWKNKWSKWVYQNLHHEPFDTHVHEWALSDMDGSPLSQANGALPWIVFCRDVQQFKHRYPNLKINSISPLMPISYLLSGGVSLRSLVPGFLYWLIRRIERPLDKSCGMFACIEIVKT